MIMVQMNNMSPSSRELAQRLYDKNVELENKRRRSAQARVPSDPNAWQQMRENYEAIILEDHDFTEQNNIEYALWQLHYRRIEEFRAHFNAALASAGSKTPQGGKVPARPDRITKLRLQFKMFLSEATGFYHDLILKVRAKYGLPLGHFEDSENDIVFEKNGKRSIEMKKGLVSCHRCLIYLGDLARYKGLYGEGGDSKSRDYGAASSYYLQAASLWSSSGNPHHQLAILSTYSGDEFVAVYRYFRSLAVDSPFSTARENLIVAFEKNRLSYSQLQGDVKSSAKELPAQASVKGRGKVEVKRQNKDSNNAAGIHELFKSFCNRFVRLNGILFTRTSMETFVEVLSLVIGDLCELLSSGQKEEQNFGTNASENGLFIIRLTAILIFTVYTVGKEAEGQSYADIVQRNVLFQNALTAVFEIMGHILKRCLDLQDPLSSYFVPGILVFVEWLACNPNIAVGTDVDDKQATVRSSFWNQCILLLNKLSSSVSGCLDNMSRYGEGETEKQVALWEDFELRGFVPLQPAHTSLDFSRKHSFGGDHSKENISRIRRILMAGKALANVVKVDQKAFRFDNGVKKFVFGVEPQISDDFQSTSYSDSPRSMSKIDDITTVAMTNSVVVQPKAQLYVEGEEEDEEIVFKPTMTEKRNDAISSNWTCYEGLGPGQSALAGDPKFHASSISDPHGMLLLQTALGIGLPLPASVANSVPQHLPPIESQSSMWLLDQQNSLANGLKSLNILENGQIAKPGSRDVSTPLAAPSSSSIQLSVNGDANGGLSYSQEKVPENVMPSNNNFMSSSGVFSGSLAARETSLLEASSRRSHANRPVRHIGPPPGFNRLPSKHNLPTPGLNLRGENAVADDYSWLDGYQLPSSMKSSELNQFINPLSYKTPQFISNEYSSVGTVNFPFPGKQVPVMQSQVETQKGWQDHHTVERFNLNHDQLQPPLPQHLIKGTQQFPVVDQQQQGQSFWTGRHFG